MGLDVMWYLKGAKDLELTYRWHDRYNGLDIVAFAYWILQMTRYLESLCLAMLSILVEMQSLGRAKRHGLLRHLLLLLSWMPYIILQQSTSG
jgi:hypothetical protein